jgi:hypothetical protein
MDRGDVIDMLEESRIRGIPVVVELRGGRRFEDRVTDIGKWNGTSASGTVKTMSRSPITSSRLSGRSRSACVHSRPNTRMPGNTDLRC